MGHGSKRKKRPFGLFLRLDAMLNFNPPCLARHLINGRCCLQYVHKPESKR